MNKRKYSIPNNRYERHLNSLRDRAWNEMSIANWDDVLYKFGRVRFGKTDDSQREVLEENDEYIIDYDDECIM